MCEVPAAQVQGGLGLLQGKPCLTMRLLEPGFQKANCSATGDAGSRGLPAWVRGQSSPGDQGRYSEQDFPLGSFPDADAC